MRYLLDTNIVSALVKDPRGPVTQRIREVGEDAVCTSVLVAAELRFGALKKGSEKLSAQLESILTALEVLPFEVPADERYAEVRWQLERGGQPIGGNDLLIAAHALVVDCTIVTANVREFERVEGLRVENWLSSK